MQVFMKVIVRGYILRVKGYPLSRIVPNTDIHMIYTHTQ